MDAVLVDRSFLTAKTVAASTDFTIFDGYFYCRNLSLMRLSSILILLLLSPFIRAQYSYSVPKKSFDPKTVIAHCFDAKYNKDNDEWVWQPNFAEKLDFGVSADGNLYTTLDTILYYTPKHEQFAMVLYTYTKDEKGQKDAAHISAPALGIIGFNLNPTTGNYDLTYCKKFEASVGGYGEGGQVSLLQVGDDAYAVKVDWGYTGQGITTTYATLYLEGEGVLSYTSGEDNGGWTDNEAERYAYDTQLKVDKAKKTITLIRTGTEINEKTNKKVPVHQTTSYQYDEDTMQYVRVCGK